MITGVIDPQLDGPSGFESASDDIGWANLGEAGVFKLQWIVSRFLKVREGFEILGGKSPHNLERVAEAVIQRRMIDPFVIVQLSHSESFPVEVRRETVYWGPDRQEFEPVFGPSGASKYVLEFGHCSATYRAHEPQVRFSCRKEEELIPALFVVWYAYSGGIPANDS